MRKVEIGTDNYTEVYNVECEPGLVSDGYHTFNELYEHRNLLFLSLMQAHWDLITYHLPDRLLHLAQKTGATQLAIAPKWDGHTPNDVIDRLFDWIKDGD